MDFIATEVFFVLFGVLIILLVLCILFLTIRSHIGYREGQEYAKQCKQYVETHYPTAFAIVREKDNVYFAIYENDTSYRVTVQSDGNETFTHTSTDISKETTFIIQTEHIRKMVN